MFCKLRNDNDNDNRPACILSGSSVIYGHVFGLNSEGNIFL